MRLPGRSWHRAAIAAALAAAIAAFAAGTFATDRPPSVAGSATPSRDSAVPSSPATPEQRPALAQTARSTADPVTVVAAGDIACDPADGSFNGGSGVGDECRAKAVARVIAKADPQALLTLGDHQYDDGRYPKFKRSYHLSYGVFKAITYPVVGNHEYYSSHRARGFFDYFGAQAGTVGEGWYSFDLGAWHLVALNSNCEMVGCERGSPQYEWLEADLEKDQSACTLAFWHSPRFSSGPHGPDAAVAPFWRLLQLDGADLVLSAHDHIYERFRRQDASGDRDARGIRQFIVGTGGAERYWIESVQRNSQVRAVRAFGALRLTLNDRSYDWAFLPALNAGVRDSGSADCV